MADRGQETGEHQTRERENDGLFGCSEQHVVVAVGEKID